MRPTRWDAIAMVRAAGMTLLTLALAWLVTAASDEGAVSWGERAGRTLPLTPLCSAVGVWAALAYVRARGEARALEALGRTPAQMAVAAVGGGVLVALVAAALIGGVSSVDVSGFYPVATQTGAWQWHNGGFEEREEGLRVGPDGAPIRLAPALTAPPSPKIPPQGRVAAAFATALSALAMSALTARVVLGGGADARSAPGPRATGYAADAVASGLAAVATVALFQATAAHRAPALASLVPSLLLLALAVWRFRAFR